MKVLIIGNCQIQYIEWRLKAQPFVQEVNTIPIHFYYNSDFRDKYLPILEKALSDAWTILTHPISDKYGKFSTSQLKSNATNVLSMTNIIFSGLHPDICYLGGMAGRIQGPLGDAHSKIVLSSYLNGLTETDCSLMFATDNYARNGFFKEWHEAALRLIDRDRHCDIKFAEQVIKNARARPCFFTDNHPTSYLLEEFLEQICKQLDDSRKFIKQPVELLPNFLADSVVWPVYDELASYHDIDYRVPEYFRQPLYLGGRSFSLHELIALFYSLYKNHGATLDDNRWVDLYNGLNMC